MKHTFAAWLIGFLLYVDDSKALRQASNDNFTIISFNDHVDWYFGEEYCSSYISTNLGSIHSYNEQISFLTLRNNTNLKDKHCWNGLYVNESLQAGLIKNESDDSFGWIDNSVFDYSYWANNEPSNDANEYCVNMWATQDADNQRDGGWNNLPVCE